MIKETYNYKGVSVAIWPYDMKKGIPINYVARAVIVDNTGVSIYNLDRETPCDNVFNSYTEAMEFATKWVHEKLESKKENKE